MGQVDAAIADYSRAIAKNSNSSYIGRALAYDRKGGKSHAAADLAAALKYDPDALGRFDDYGLRFDQSPATLGGQAKAN